jgi:type IV fimbrial biogenesis protein FimT
VVGVGELLDGPQERQVLVTSTVDRSARGFTLVELMIGLAMIAILMLLALPSYNEFMGNSRIRNTADSLVNGLRQAQVEAVRRNRSIEFILDPANGWRLFDPTDNATLHTEPFSDANGQIVVDPNPPGTTKLTYTGLGQYVPGANPSDATPVMTSIRITHASLASPHDLRVTADPAWGAGVRVCDKRFATTDPVGCPAGVP